jgi:hypothetical protein
MDQILTLKIYPTNNALLPSHLRNLGFRKKKYLEFPYIIYNIM